MLWRNSRRCGAKLLAVIGTGDRASCNLLTGVGLTGRAELLLMSAVLVGRAPQNVVNFKAVNH
jgi:hypothetical protein